MSAFLADCRMVDVDAVSGAVAVCLYEDWAAATRALPNANRTLLLSQASIEPLPGSPTSRRRPTGADSNPGSSSNRKSARSPSEEGHSRYSADSITALREMILENRAVDFLDLEEERIFGVPSFEERDEAAGADAPHADDHRSRELADAQFLRRIAEASDSVAIQRVFERLEPFVRTFVTLILPNVDVDEILHEHEAIPSAIRASDGPGAAAAAPARQLNVSDLRSRQRLTSIPQFVGCAVPHLN